jgi:hypothetical protein
MIIQVGNKRDLKCVVVIIVVVVVIDRTVLIVPINKPIDRGAGAPSSERARLISYYLAGKKSLSEQEFRRPQFN